MTEIAITRHGPKPGTKKPRPSVTTLPIRRLSDFPHLGNLKPSLTYMKLHHPTKGYKLVWQFMGKVVYCGENQTVYKSRGRVMEAGGQLAGLLGVTFKL